MDKIIRKIRKCESFDDLYNHTTKLTKKEKGDLFEYITFYMFKLCPILNHDILDVWLYGDIPNDIKEKLKLPEKDKGIDILIRKKDQYNAIQCKFRQDSDQVIAWKELSTFFGLTFGMTSKMNVGYFVTNTYDMCEQVLKSDKVVQIDGTFFDNNLPNDFFRAMHSILFTKIVKKQLRTK
jgi:predicted helicase